MVFAAFVLHAKDAAFTSSRLDQVCTWFWQINVSIARAALFVMRSGRKVRQAVRHDRRLYLEGVKAGVAQQDIKNPKELFAALRRAFPCMRSSRKGGFKPLPQLLLEDGTPASTQEERLQRWRSFFAEQEAGFPVTDAQYVVEFQAQKDLHTGRPTTFDWQALPTLREIEALLHQQRRGKACGNDGITPELLCLDVPLSARRFLPILAKTTLRVHEPSAFRGGSLMTLAKKVAAECHCSHYRSILLACTPSKVYHRYLRQQLVPVLQDCRQPLQAGAVPGIGVESLSLLARVIQDLFTRARRYRSLALFDIKAAFYRVIRQLVLRVPETDEHLCRLVHSLGLPGTALQELQQKLQALAMIPQAASSQHLSELASDVMQGTYFRMDADHVTLMTKRGSRPGDPLADVIFGFLLAGFTATVDRQLDDLGLGCHLPDLQQPLLVDTPPFDSKLGFISWADDCLRASVQDSRDGAMTAALQVVQTTVEIGATLGVEFTFHSTKTCIMLPSFQPTTTLGPAAEPPVTRCSFRNRHTQQDFEIEVVSVYKHLGCLLTSNASPMVEIQYRSSHAHGICRPLAYRYFSCRQFPLTTRRYILKSLAVSRFQYGSVALTLRTGVCKRQWYRSYISLWRSLQRRDPATKKFAHPYKVLLDAQAPSPPLALALARACFLQRIALFGPCQVLWALQCEWEQHPPTSWLHQVHEDVRLVALTVPAVRVLLQANCTVRALLCHPCSKHRTGGPAV